MRILFISAFYPPFVVGGWEQLVQDINLSLKARGHTTLVLTSNHGNPGPQAEDGVRRILTLESNLNYYEPFKFFWGREQRQRANLQHLADTINTFSPDVIFVHVMWNLWRGIPWFAEQLQPGRVVYYIADDWPYATDIHTRYWRTPANHPAGRLFKQIVAPIALKTVMREVRAVPLQFQKVVCVSQTVKENLVRCVGISPERMRVIYNGVETDRFVPPTSWPDDHRDSRKLSLLYAGSLVSTKGVHTAIEAMAILAREPRHSEITLTLAGGGHPDYEARLRTMVREFNLADRVRFIGRVARDDMPDLLRKSDVLVFPSLGEALPRIVQEAMATGLVVVGTTAGGTREILIDHETGLTFEPGDAASLARQIGELGSNPDLRTKLARQGRDIVLRQFDMRRMIDEIGDYLQQSVQQGEQRL